MIFSPGGFKLLVVIVNSYILYLTCLWYLGWIWVDSEWDHQFHLGQQSFYQNMSLWIVIIYFLHQFFYWNYHDWVKCIKLWLKYRWWHQVSACFVYQVCVLGQFRWPWLMSNDFFQILILWGLKTYVKYFDGYQGFLFDPYFLRVYINIPLKFVSSFEM